MSLLHRVEDYGYKDNNKGYISLSFNTKYRGIWQCLWTNKGMSEFPAEPSFESLKAEEQQTIEEVGPYVFYLTHGNFPNS